MKTLLLELGVGYNTPGIIRYPFEEMAQRFPAGHLVRVNLVRPDLPPAIGDRGTAIREDLGIVLKDLAYACDRQSR